jgi:hypothetical protein
MASEMKTTEDIQAPQAPLERQEGMSQGEMQEQQAQDLPDREAMSLVEVGDINVDVDAMVNAPINADIDAMVYAPIDANVDIDAMVNAPIDANVDIDALVNAPINADVDIPINVGGEQTITYGDR